MEVKQNSTVSIHLLIGCSLEDSESIQLHFCQLKKHLFCLIKM